MCAHVDLSRAFVDHPVCGSLACISGVCVCTCGSLTCICGLCARVWILDRPVDPLRIVVDCVCECGSLTCICGRIWYCFHSILVLARLDYCTALLADLSACIKPFQLIQHVALKVVLNELKRVHVTHLITLLWFLVATYITSQRGIHFHRPLLWPFVAVAINCLPAHFPEMTKNAYFFMNTWPIKGIDHPKMKMTPWFTHPQAIVNAYDFLLSEKKHNQSYINKYPGSSRLYNGSEWLPWLWSSKKCIHPS